MAPEKNNKKVLNAWVLYYWANSAFPLVITATLFPIYFNRSTEAAFGGEILTFMGMEFVNSALYAYALSFSFLIITLVSPVLSGLADYSGLKKRFLIGFTFLGALASAGLFLFEGSNLSTGLTAFILASIGFSGSHIFYNAYLPQIATPDRFDRLSARGFSLGYIGGSVMLILSLLIITWPEFWGIRDNALPKRIAFLITGGWWLTFGMISNLRLPPAPHRRKINWSTLTYGFKEIRLVWRELAALPDLKTFLSAFFLFSTGLQTVLVVAVMFGDREIGMPQHLLIMTILIIQFVAVGGAFLFAWLSRIYGNILALTVCLLIWIAICGGAFFVTGSAGFMSLAGVVGLVMGGTQAISRSTFTKLLPERKDHNAFFSFYEILEKIAIAIGTLSFGIIVEITGSMRNAALALAVFFVLGLWVLWKIRRVKWE